MQWPKYSCLHSFSCKFDSGADSGSYVCQYGSIALVITVRDKNLLRCCHLAVRGYDLKKVLQMVSPISFSACYGWSYLNKENTLGVTSGNDLDPIWLHCLASPLVFALPCSAAKQRKGFSNIFETALKIMAHWDAAWCNTMQWLQGGIAWECKAWCKTKHHLTATCRKPTQQRFIQTNSLKFQ